MLCRIRESSGALRVVGSISKFCDPVMHTVMSVGRTVYVYHEYRTCVQQQPMGVMALADRNDSRSAQRRRAKEFLLNSILHVSFCHATLSYLRWNKPSFDKRVEPRVD